MIDAGQLVDAFVEHLQAIPELVPLLNPNVILAYHPLYAAEKSLSQAIHDMPQPGILVAWRGWNVGGFANADVFKHQLAIYIRAGKDPVAGTPGPLSYYKLSRLIWSGIPATEDNPGLQPMKYLVLHPSCYPMDPPSGQMLSDEESVDYFEMAVSFTEKGDDA